MSLKKINPRFAVLVLLMIAAAAMRLPNAAHLTPWSNFTPIGAMGLFGGAYFSKNWKAFAFPLVALLASDIIIDVIILDNQFGVLYAGWYWIYLGFCVIVLIGKWLLKKITIKNVLIAGISSTLVYWLIVDFAGFFVRGTDITTGLRMEHTFPNLIKYYAQGAPYIKNFLLGTLVYSGLMFGTFEWLKTRNPKLQAALK